MTVESAIFALYLALALVPSLLLHEWAHAVAATRLGDRTPQLYGWLGFKLKPKTDPFGTIILPALLILLQAANVRFPVFAYTKPMPRNPNVLRRPDRDTGLIALAGPGVNLILAVLAGLALRVVYANPAVPASEVARFVFAVLQINVTFFVFYLMPIPGLDGALILQRFLKGRAREVFANLDQYLPLWMLLIFFLLGAPVLTIVQGLANVVCRVAAGAACF